LPRLVVLRLDGGLFFATAEALEDRIRELQDGADPPLRTLVLDLEGVNFIDAQGAAKLTEIEELTDAEGISLRLARVKPNVRTVLQSDGIIERIGEDHIHGNVHRAVEASSADGGGSSDGR
jgi:sulfate permease, SulP family